MWFTNLIHDLFKWMFVPTLACKFSDNVHHGWTINAQVSIMCSFSSWAITCSRTPTGRSCSNKYWGCEVTVENGKPFLLPKVSWRKLKYLNIRVQISWTVWYEIASCLAPHIVNLLVLCWIDTLRTLILQVCLTSQGFSALSNENVLCIPDQSFEKTYNVAG